MSEKELRDFFADVQNILKIKIGLFCDRNNIYRPDFSNFMKGKRYFCSLGELQMMHDDIMDHVSGFLDIYKKVA